MTVPMLKNLTPLAELFNLEILTKDAGAYWGGIPSIFVKDSVGNVATIWLNEKAEYVSNGKLDGVPMKLTDKKNDQERFLIEI
ncbi:hypothetical protein ACFL2U_02630 [Patescibacteria group bacterium]